MSLIPTVELPVRHGICYPETSPNSRLSQFQGIKRTMSRILKLLCLSCCLLAASCGPKEAEVGWESVELGTDAEFRDVFFLDSQNGWIVGKGGVGITGGIIGRTRDGGGTWTYRSGLIGKRPRTRSVDLNAVVFVDTLRGCIAAGAGTMITTTDGGETWDRIPPTGPVYAQNKDIDFVDDRNGWVIGRQGVLRTDDGGDSWRRVDEEEKMTGDALDFLDLEHGWVVGKFGAAHRTEDGGVTWEKVEAWGDLEGLSGDEMPKFTSVHFSDENHGWIAGYIREFPGFEQHDWGVIIHTSDGGRTWEHQLDGVESLLKSIRFENNRRGWAVGYNVNDGTAQILATENGGGSWEIQTTIHGEELLALFERDGQVWAVGDRVREKPQRMFRLIPALGVGKSGEVQ